MGISFSRGTGRRRSALRTKRASTGFLRLLGVFFTLALLIAVVASRSSDQTKSQGQIPGYKNPHLSVEQRVADLLSRMTLEEKIAQMTCLWVNRPQKNAPT